MSFTGINVSGFTTTASCGEYWKPEKSFAFPSPTPNSRSHVRVAFWMRKVASSSELSNCRMSRIRYPKG